MARPPLVTLRLTDPRMEGELVREVQHRFRGHGIEQDGIYGCETARSVADWQWRTGAPNHAGAIPPAELLVLLGYRTRPLEWIARGRARKGTANPRAVSCPGDSPLTVIPRDKWLDFPPRGVSVVRHYPGIPHVVHWFGPGKPAGSREAEIAQARGFARYHRFTLGWADIGYNWVALSDGTILEGRGDNVRGAHSGHSTANTYPGLLIMAGTEQARPADAALEAAIALRRLKRWGRRTGHLEWRSTSCPGPFLWPWVQRNR